MVTEWAQLITIWNVLKSLFSTEHSPQHFQVVDKFISLEVFYKAATLLQIIADACWQWKILCLPSFILINNSWHKNHFLHWYICICIFSFGLCRLCTQGRRRAGRSTARRRAQMGSASAPWSHRPRTCVTATHAAGSFANSWRRWQLSITHSLWDTTVMRAGIHTQKHKLSHSAALVYVPSVT